MLEPACLPAARAAEAAVAEYARVFADPALSPLSAVACAVPLRLLRWAATASVPKDCGGRLAKILLLCPRNDVERSERVFVRPWFGDGAGGAQIRWHSATSTAIIISASWPRTKGSAAARIIRRTSSSANGSRVTRGLGE